MARILLLEDETMVRTVLCRTLTSAGHSVLDSSNATDVKEMVALVGADLIIADAMLRGADGIVAVRETRSSFPRLPIIVISGADRGDIARRLQDCGLASAVWFLAKPFGGEELLATVRAALAG
jgi:DNA-binding response OmpR family regulator